MGSIFPRKLIKVGSLLPTERRLTAANGAPVTLDGEAELIFDFQGLKVGIWGMVSSQVHEVMLGMDFLQGNKTRWDFAAATLSMYGRQFPLYIVPGRDLEKVQAAEVTGVSPQTSTSQGREMKVDGRRQAVELVRRMTGAERENGSSNRRWQGKEPPQNRRLIEQQVEMRCRMVGGSEEDEEVTGISPLKEAARRGHFHVLSQTSIGTKRLDHGNVGWIRSPSLGVVDARSRQETEKTLLGTRRVRFSEVSCAGLVSPSYVGYLDDVYVEGISFPKRREGARRSLDM
jgi:hypothetical protein